MNAVFVVTDELGFYCSHWDTQIFSSHLDLKTNLFQIPSIMKCKRYLLFPPYNKMVISVIILMLHDFKLILGNNIWQPSEKCKIVIHLATLCSSVQEACGSEHSWIVIMSQQQHGLVLTLCLKFQSSIIAFNRSNTWSTYRVRFVPAEPGFESLKVWIWIAELGMVAVKINFVSQCEIVFCYLNVCI